MQSCICLGKGTRVLLRPARSNVRKAGRVQSRSGRVEPFNEGAAQVQRLVSRDRKELLGNQIDILDKYTTEFGDPDDDTPVASTSASNNGSSSTTTTTTTTTTAAATTTATAAAVASPFAAAPAAAPPAAKPSAVQTKFTGSSSAASPFGSSPRPRVIQEPKGLSPDMSPDPIEKPKPLTGNWLSRITLTQVVLFCTFSSMILLMLATFSVVLNSGAIRLAGID